MKILVVIKQVPDSTTNIKIRPDGEDIERAGVKMVVDPFDEFAIEQAVRLKETRSDVEAVTVLIMGSAQCSEALRTALAVGADDAIHLHDDAFEKLDELQQAAAIAAVISDGGYDLVFRGKQEIDLDSGQLGPALAEALGWPHVGAATKFEMAEDGKSFIANRRIEGADEVVEVQLPALVTTEKGLCEMRYPSLPNLMKAKRKPVKTMTAADVPGFAEVIAAVGGSKMHGLAPPPARPPGKILKGETGDTVKELVRLLREEAKAI
ncbi:MAG: electron transfer flavoprotein subunit beta/FixA family protein [Planctomycetes bacterium]|nr:electron transfer flavoprotein subunit beta/FixA family protein [Planctomycetota bacterium]